MIWPGELDELAAEIGPAVQRFRPGPEEANRLADVLAAAEELGEAAEKLDQAQLGIIRAGLKGFHGQRAGQWNAELEKELMDALIAVLACCYHRDIRPTGAIRRRWEEVRQR